MYRLRSYFHLIHKRGYVFGIECNYRCRDPGCDQEENTQSCSYRDETGMENEIRIKNKIRLNKTRLLVGLLIIFLYLAATIRIIIPTV